MDNKKEDDNNKEVSNQDDSVRKKESKFDENQEMAIETSIPELDNLADENNKESPLTPSTLSTATQLPVSDDSIPENCKNRIIKMPKARVPASPERNLIRETFPPSGPTSSNIIINRNKTITAPA